MLVGGSSSSNVSATTVSAATASMTATSRGSSHGIFAFHGRQRSTAGVSHSPATSVSQRPPERRASAATSLFGSASPIDALARIVSSYGDITSGSTRTSSAAVAAPVVRETTSAAAPPLPPGTVSTAHDDAPFVNVDYNDSGQVRVRRSDSVESMFTVHQPAKLLPPKAAPSSTSSRPSSSASSIGGKRVSKSQMELQVSLTRQRTLPPKNAEEEQRHLAEHQKMMREFQKKGKHLGNRVDVLSLCTYVIPPLPTDPSRQGTTATRGARQTSR